MVKFRALAAGTVLCVSIVTLNARAAQTENAVTACVREAESGWQSARRLEPSLRFMIDQQRMRMASSCRSLASAPADAGRLSDCLIEAARGPRHIQQGRNMDRAHISRQKALCEAAARNAS